MPTYKTMGVCSRQIDFDVDNGIVHNVSFQNGCSGNLQAVGKLVEGRSVDDVVRLLKGIECQGNTSCPDQLAKALEHYL